MFVESSDKTAEGLNVWSMIRNLLCVVRKIIAAGRSGRGLRRNISQLVEGCRQAWLNDDGEPWLEA